MKPVDTEKGIRRVAGVTAAAVASVFFVGAAVSAQQPSGTSSSSGTIPLASRLPAVSTTSSNSLPPLPGVTRKGVLPSAVYTARVDGVVDGATLVLRRDSNGLPYQVRLYGVDAPPAGSAADQRAKEMLRTQVQGQTVQVQSRAPGQAMVYLLPTEGAALAAGATSGTSTPRPALVLRPYTGSVDPSGTARDLSTAPPSAAAGNPAGAVPQDRPQSVPGGLTLTLNEGIIRAGWARYDSRRAPNETALSIAQEDAKRAGRGIWAANSPKK